MQGRGSVIDCRGPCEIPAGVSRSRHRDPHRQTDLTAGIVIPMTGSPGVPWQVREWNCANDVLERSVLKLTHSDGLNAACYTEYFHFRRHRDCATTAVCPGTLNMRQVKAGDSPSSASQSGYILLVAIIIECFCRPKYTHIRESPKAMLDCLVPMPNPASKLRVFVSHHITMPSCPQQIVSHSR